MLSGMATASTTRSFKVPAPGFNPPSEPNFLRRVINRLLTRDKPAPAPPPVQADRRFDYPDPDAEGDCQVPQDPLDDILLGGEWLYVGSTNVEAFRYLCEERVLEVAFLSGSHYQYFDVPYHVVKGFGLTDSPGRYVWNALRDRYPYTRLSGIGAARRKPAPQVIRVRHDIP